MIKTIQKTQLKSNGLFSMVKGPYEKEQHPNQQGGLDLYVDVIDEITGNLNQVKLYENKKGLHFKKNGTHYLYEFNINVVVVPFQVLRVD